MAKLTLFDLTSGSYTVDLLNQNFALIETAMENTLSRDGLAPNVMGANFDMNSFRILNLPTAVGDSEPVTLGQVNAMGTLNIYTPANHSHAWGDISGKPSTYAPSAHTHPQADITNLTTDLGALDTRLDTIEALPNVYVQSGTPTAEGAGDLWFW